MKTYNFKSGILVFSSLLVAGLLSSCGKSDADFDAAGTFESTEILVSSEAQGKILAFDILEGQELSANQQIGEIDSTQLYLKVKQLKANSKAVQNRKPDVKKQLAVLEQQIATARVELKRIQNLVAVDAVNKKQLDDINAQIAFLEKQRSAQQSTLDLTSNSISGEEDALQIQIEQLEDQLSKCHIISPISGTVLNKYAEAGELAIPGKTLFKIADTKNMFLRAYVTSDQLTTLKLGQKVKVYSDLGETDSKEYAGTITWISAKAEFTPKTIQTRDERANLVYAVKIAVVNDGLIKIGMYGNVRF